MVRAKKTREQEAVGNMGASSIATRAPAGDPGHALYQRIGAFLATHHLSPDPRHYAFAYDVVSDDAGPLAKAVAALTDGGIRLSSHDIESLGGEIGTLGPSPELTEGEPDDAQRRADQLVARTQHQVEGFSDMVRAMHHETAGFGRDLAASAAAMGTQASTPAIEEIARLTGTILERVHTAEGRLEAATHEASSLREALEAARADALRDPLTNLPNRRAFEEGFAGADTETTPICIAMCDVDCFKSVNDRFGHAVGDRVLRAIGTALTEGCGGHLVARYGGEEFAILFNGVDLATARALLDATREHVAAKRYRLRETDAPLGAVTFSAGISPVGPGEMLGTAFARADTLLYRAKSEGRNRVIAE
jgi:diguanylate cyclase